MIGEMTEEGLVYVLGHLCAEDLAELKATVDQGAVEATARLILSIPGPKWEVQAPDGEPAAVGGVVPFWPGLASGWMWGTDRWDEIILEVTRAIKRHILPTLDARGMHRIECRPMASNRAAIRWLGLLGFEQEAITPSFGRGSEDFALCARISSHDPRRSH